MHVPHFAPPHAKTSPTTIHNEAIHDCFFGIALICPTRRKEKDQTKHSPDTLIHSPRRYPTTLSSFRPTLHARIFLAMSPY
mmetsp:Transcript_18826/g.52606  ORF Transcript_18826/g.52606 Transcript_18826/m.52606 type:complete len:81 (+) Transcript_18826:1160-1402(+)